MLSLQQFVYTMVVLMVFASSTIAQGTNNTTQSELPETTRSGITSSSATEEILTTSSRASTSGPAATSSVTLGDVSSAILSRSSSVPSSTASSSTHTTSSAQISSQFTTTSSLTSIASTSSSVSSSTSSSSSSSTLTDVMVLTTFVIVGSSSTPTVISRTVVKVGTVTGSSLAEVTAALNAASQENTGSGLSSQNKKIIIGVVAGVAGLVVLAALSTLVFRFIGKRSTLDDYTRASGDPFLSESHNPYGSTHHQILNSKSRTKIDEISKNF